MTGRTPVAPWRTLALQASFNLRGMQRGGWWFALSPWLGRMDPEQRRAWFARERAVFNTNPYLAPVLLGARCRIEEDHGAELADRVEDTMQRTLGSLGDSLTWRAVRPLCFLGMALAGTALGPRAILVAWLAFVAGVWVTHWRGQSWAYSLGLDVIDRLAASRLHAVAQAGRRVAGVLAGVVGLGILALTLGTAGESLVVLASLVAVGLGFLLTRLRRGAEWALLLAMGGLILFARWSGQFPEAVITWR